MSISLLTTTTPTHERADLRVRAVSGRGINLIAKTLNKEIFIKS